MFGRKSVDEGGGGGGGGWGLILSEFRIECGNKENTLTICFKMKGRFLRRVCWISEDI